MAGPQADTANRPLRADARVNRERLLEAARDVFIEIGPRAPLEEISRRAGTGIATLYRRFPDRQSLMRAVVLQALHRTTEAARRAAAESDPFEALTRYLHDVLDLRTAAVIPVLMEEISLQDEDILAARRDGAEQVEKLVAAAHRAGTLREDVGAGDIGSLLVQLSRPLPGGVDREVADRLGHRHVDLVINGLRAVPEPGARIPGRPVSLGDLRDARRR